MKGFTLIDNVWVEDRIFSTYFSCDYDKCKGACCWAGDAKDYDGGTLLAEEAQEILLRKTALSLRSRVKTCVVLPRIVQYIPVTAAFTRNFILTVDACT